MCIRWLYTTYPVGQGTDCFAEGLLRTLLEEGPAALANPQDYDVRANLMWTAYSSCVPLRLLEVLGSSNVLEHPYANRPYRLQFHFWCKCCH